MSLASSFPTAKVAVFGLFLQRAEMGQRGGQSPVLVAEQFKWDTRKHCQGGGGVWESGTESKDLG